jgi:signal transduction histidine kinase
VSGALFGLPRFHYFSADPKLSGIGLGLSICRGFVEAMGGTIVAADRADRAGSVFTITFRR